VPLWTDYIDTLPVSQGRPGRSESDPRLHHEDTKAQRG